MKLAVIPARGGSKRIPRKNIRPFLGKPLIAYSIETAFKSGCFDEIIVSTDDKEIADVACQYGATVPFTRPSDLADDFTTTGSVIRHAIAYYDAEAIPVDFICCIYATAPLLTTHDLQTGLDILQDSEQSPPLSYVFSGARFTYPIQRALRMDSAGRISMLTPELYTTRSQDLEECFHDAGQFYWGRAEAFRRELPIFESHSSMVLIPPQRVQDIDTEDDWIRAEQLYRLMTEYDEP